MMARFYRLSFSPAFHYLPLGDYAASDMDRVGMFRGHMWRWGNFINPSDPLPPCLERKGEFRLLWAGRMLPWKRVDTLIRAFAALHHRRPPARLTLIGTGVSREPWQNLVRQLGVESQVEFQDSIPIAQVRQAMRDSHAYVLPSSGYEGWGVVINEAMSEGCTVVASRAAGAPKTLIRHGENGLLFSPGNHEELSRLLIQLSEDEPLRRKLGEAGQRTIVDGWTPAIAARRFLDFCHTMLSNRPLPDFTDGPMAPAWKR
jgi:glycosyltransferase involved in cell wall biosynthesis